MNTGISAAIEGGASVPSESQPFGLPLSAPQRSRAKPLSILQVAHKYPPFMGGIEVHTREVSVRLARKGHRVTVMTGDPTGRLPTEEMDEGIRILRFPVYPASSDIFFGPALAPKLVRAEWDVAHIQGFHTLVPPIALASALYARRPFVMTFHSGGHSSKTRNAIRGIQQRILRPLIARADQLIAVSEFEADSFSDGLRLPRNRFVVVPNGAEIARPSEPVAVAPADRPLILSVGRLERYKGHHRVLTAFAEFLKLRPEARLRIAGQGPFEAELKAQVEALGLSGKVEIAGIAPGRRQEMAELMCRASLVALLSEYEAHPVAALEAVSLGCKVIALDSTGFAEMARAGLLRGVDPASGDAAIAAIMVEEIDKPADPASMPRVGTWDDCADRLLEIYQQVVSRRGGRDTVVAPEPGSSLPAPAWGK